MRTMRIVILLLWVALASSALAVEQEAGARFIVGVPVGSFGDAVDNEGFGLDAHYGLRLRPSLTVGIGLNGMIYGSETRSYSLPLVEDFDLNTSNYVAGSFLFAQWRPLTGAVQPYVEARAGFNYLWTESALEDEDWWNDDEVARKTNYDDFATYWGGGGGLLIRLATGDRASGKHGVLLDLKATYQKGAEAEYLTEGDITLVGDVPVFNASESRTDMVMYQMGIVLTF